MPFNLNQICCLWLSALVIGGCELMPPMLEQPEYITTDYTYTIAPGDRLDIFVWRNENISVSNIPVMPDGRISIPLVEEIMASGKTPKQLADNIENELSNLIADPFVTVTVVNFEGGYSQQIRVVGEATDPSAIPYRTDMSLLDVMIMVGGLTEFAAGNRASIVRNINGNETQFRVRLEDLIRRGDLSANLKVAPGDILIIPESFF
jgi:polysaccharide export outer membrane protein